MAYSISLDGVQFPVMPSKIKTKINNNNKTMTLINEGEVNLLKTAGLTDFQFDLLLPLVQYPFAVYPDGFHNPKYYTDRLKALKNSLQPFKFTITRETSNGKTLFYTDREVSLESYQIEESTNEGGDWVVTVALKLWRDYGTQTVSLEEDAEGDIIATFENERETGGAPTASAYMVESGDCLWNISKKFLGDGSRYNEIYELNKDKISNPNLIQPGQVLTLPT